MLTLDDIPTIAAAATRLVDTITASIAPNSARGKQVTRKELYAIMKAAAELVIVIATELAD